MIDRKELQIKYSGRLVELKTELAQARTLGDIGKIFGVDPDLLLQPASLPQGSPEYYTFQIEAWDGPYQVVLGSYSGYPAGEAKLITLTKEEEGIAGDNVLLGVERMKWLDSEVGKIVLYVSVGGLDSPGVIDVKDGGDNSKVRIEAGQRKGKVIIEGVGPDGHIAPACIIDGAQVTLGGAEPGVLTIKNSSVRPSEIGIQAMGPRLDVHERTRTRELEIIDLDQLKASLPTITLKDGTVTAGNEQAAGEISVLGPGKDAGSTMVKASGVTVKGSVFGGGLQVLDASGRALASTRVVPVGGGREVEEFVGNQGQGDLSYEAAVWGVRSAKNSVFAAGGSISVRLKLGRGSEKLLPGMAVRMGESGIEPADAAMAEDVLGVYVGDTPDGSFGINKGLTQAAEEGGYVAMYGVVDCLVLGGTRTIDSVKIGDLVVTVGAEALGFAMKAPAGTKMRDARVFGVVVEAPKAGNAGEGAQARVLLLGR